MYSSEFQLFVVIFVTVAVADAAIVYNWLDCKLNKQSVGNLI